ncbi:hypothetical protein [Streptomyces sp. NPDC051561]|uniref:hypothetical protein n=1 Tax=Streptomyces sp. NPDC051561 TaxID=3365658 RepID=UPI003787503B
MERLSASLRLHRLDKGQDLRRLGRTDIVDVLQRMAYLQEQGSLSVDGRYKAVTRCRQVLRRMRSLGFTGSGHLLDGLAGDFVLRSEDIPGRGGRL